MNDNIAEIKTKLFYVVDKLHCDILTVTHFFSVDLTIILILLIVLDISQLSIIQNSQESALILNTIFNLKTAITNNRNRGHSQSGICSSGFLFGFWDSGQSRPSAVKMRLWQWQKVKGSEVVRPSDGKEPLVFIQTWHCHGNRYALWSLWMLEWY